MLNRLVLYQQIQKTCCLHQLWLKKVCVDNEFSNPSKLYLGEDALYNLIDSMIEGSINIVVI